MIKNKDFLGIINLFMSLEFKGFCLLFFSVMFGLIIYFVNSKEHISFTRLEVLNNLIVRQSIIGGGVNLEFALKDAMSVDSSLKISDLYQKHPILVCRFTDNNCHVCIKSSIERIKKVMNSYGNEGIVLLISQSNKKYIHLFCLDNSIKIPVFVVDYNFIEYEIEKLNVPYFFVLDNKGEGNCLFIPEKSMPDLTEMYLSKIAQKYFYHIE